MYNLIIFYMGIKMWNYDSEGKDKMYNPKSSLVAPILCSFLIPPIYIPTISLQPLFMPKQSLLCFVLLYTGVHFL